MRLSSLIFVGIILLFGGHFALAERSVRLITVGPGDAVWEKFGHNMIEIVADPGYGQDVAFNWGLFDFDQPYFIARFVQGRMLYTMAALRSGPMLEEYRAQNRSIFVQELDLTQQEIDRLIALCEWNRLPENRDYRYDYFKDNCSTRVRDMIDRATQGRLRQVLVAHSDSGTMTYRQHALRLMQETFWLSLGVDFALGPSCDRRLDPWDEAFLPERLSELIQPMVKASWSASVTTRPPEPRNVPDRSFLLLMVGLTWAGGMWAMHRWGTQRLQRSAIGLAIAWWIWAAAGGVFMLYVWIFTDHTAGYANQNLLHFSPLSTILLLLWGMKHSRWSRRISPFLIGIVGIVVSLSLLGMVLKLTGILSQANIPFILLALPLNIVSGLTVLRSIGLLKA